MLVRHKSLQSLQSTKPKAQSWPSVRWQLGTGTVTKASVLYILTFTKLDWLYVVFYFNILELNHLPTSKILPTDGQ